MSEHAVRVPSKITIYLDGEPHRIRAGNTRVSVLRTLTTPPLGDDKQIWLDIEDALDEVLDDARLIELREGMRFFTEVKPIHIRIDRIDYELFTRKMTGADLRSLPSPDVAADRDLWRDVPDKRDVKVQDEDVVQLQEGMRFFTAPGRINPGASR